MPIIINGEVVPDNDPRAVARRNRGRQPQTRGGSGGFGRIGGSTSRASGSSRFSGQSNSGMGQGRSSNGNSQRGPGPLAGLENMLGVSGKTFKVPAIMGNPSFEIPVVVLIILAFVTLLTSWRVGLGGCLLVYLYYNSLQTPSPQ